MLNRQKTIIELVRAAGRPVSRFELTKWSFLLRHAFPSAGGSSFYDFVPYQYGPFSFTLFQELDKLEAMNYLHQQDDYVSLGRRELVNTVALENKVVSGDVALLLNRFAKKKRDELTQYVYSNYPDYTCNSRLRRLTKRPVAKPAVYTAGYEGRSIDAFLNLLVRSGIQCLIDVRRNPIARRYGFHRSTLQRLCGRLDIDYVHMPSLGIASEKRQELSDAASYRSLFAEYKKDTLRIEKPALKKVGSLMSDRASVLVCMEQDPAFCHRTAVAEEIAKLTSLSICNLGCGHECDAH
jgi:uncharacterized protein (DUF488 family)